MDILEQDYVCTSGVREYIISMGLTSQAPFARNWFLIRLRDRADETHKRALELRALPPDARVWGAVITTLSPITLLQEVRKLRRIVRDKNFVVQ